MHDFGLWEDTGLPGQNPHKHSEDMQPHPPEALKQNLFTVGWQQCCIYIQLNLNLSKTVVFDQLPFWQDGVVMRVQRLLPSAVKVWRPTKANKSQLWAQGCPCLVTGKLKNNGRKNRYLCICVFQNGFWTLQRGAEAIWLDIHHRL